MAELVSSGDSATVDGVLRLSADGFTPVDGYDVARVRTGSGLRYDVLTPAGERVSWTAPGGVARTLVLGGARSGKSTEAERLLADAPDTVYVATGGDGSADPEWADRIAKHRARRPASWGLVETIELVPLLEVDGPPLLIDCLTLWLARTMDACEIWEHPENLPAVEQRIDELAAAWSAGSRKIVAVSNEVGSGLVPADAGTRLFRDLMGRLNATISRESDLVLWCVAGRTIAL
ncbi:bifunctional adenosylcobinamide kinase/adenosylcobinamide-phosphate guanylyltransferase [Kribbella sp. NPDC051770]|uniref:bifunctional adenosylcobinamide kinase/adenosylcobinamide-phosphate guanylyltransferase n=1 Tax=Kribbella sp. NPDC051770 TaxID=3155413 RepID=UPI00342D8FE1